MVHIGQNKVQAKDIKIERYRQHTDTQSYVLMSYARGRYVFGFPHCDKQPGTNQLY